MTHEASRTDAETAATPDAPAPRGWWRRNALALAASLLLAGGLAVTMTTTEYREYYDARPSQPVRAGLGETLALDGATFTLVDVERLHPGGLPRDAAAVRVTVEVAAAAGGGLPAGCLIALSEAGGSHPDRSWNAGASHADILPVEGTETLCPTEPTGDYTLAVPFIVPDDVDGTLTLEIAVGDSLPRFAALELGPLP